MVVFSKALFFLLLGTVSLTAGAGSMRLGPKSFAQTPPLSAQEHYMAGLRAVEEEEWQEALKQLEYVTIGYPDSSFAKESPYYLGVTYYHLEEYEKSNQAFSSHLKQEAIPRHFEEVFTYKFQVAELYRQGRRRPLFGLSALPRLQSGKEQALEIYDDITASLPNHELGCKSLYYKGLLLWDMGEHEEAVEHLQMVVLRFPKSPLAPESFMATAKIYLDQSRVEKSRPDLLDLARVNVRNFRKSFPTDERVLAAESLIEEMKEVFASGLYRTGRYFERTKKGTSAEVYYQTVLQQYPDTHVAEQCQERLSHLKPPEQVVDEVEE